MIALNLSALPIIWFIENQFIAALDSSSKVFIKSEAVFAKLERVLSSAKLCTDALLIKKEKSLIKALKSMGPAIEPWGTSEIIFRNSLLILLIFTRCFLFCRYRKKFEQFYHLFYMLKVLQLTDHGGCNQMLLKGPSERLQLHNHCPILISILLLIKVKHVDNCNFAYTLQYMVRNDYSFLKLNGF